MKSIFTYLLSFLFIAIGSSTLKSQAWEDHAIGLLPTSYGVFDVSIVNEDVIWAVAFNQTLGGNIPSNHITKVLKTTDGGANWESFDVEEAEGRISFDIVAFDENTAFMTTQDLGSGAGRGVFKTDDGGTTWTEVYHHRAGGVWIRFFNLQEGVVINRQRIATTQDGGETWQLVEENTLPPFHENEFTVLGSGNNSCQVVDNHVWFGTTRGRVFRSKDKGHSWEVFNTSLGSNALVLSVAFRDTLNGLAINANGPTTKFARTQDGGETWENIESSPSIFIANIAYVPHTNAGFVATSDLFVPQSQRRSAYSNDFGQSWTFLTSNIAFGGTQFNSADIGWSSRGMIGSPNDAALFKWIGDVFVNTTSIEAEKDIQIFPNPLINDNLNIHNESNTSFSYRLFTTKGQIIQSGKISPNQSFIEFDNLEQGMYQLEFELEDGSKIVKKLIKVN